MSFKTLIVFFWILTTPICFGLAILVGNEGAWPKGIVYGLFLLLWLLAGPFYAILFPLVIQHSRRVLSSFIRKK